MPSQRDIAYFVGRRPEGQVATIEDLMGMSSIDISRRPDLIKAYFYSQYGVPLTSKPLVNEGLADIRRTRVLTKAPIISLN